MTAKLFSAESSLGYIWLEGEKATTISGDYKIRSDGRAGEGERLNLDSTDREKDHRAGYSFKVAKAGSYDIWVLSSAMTEDYASRVKWILDQTGPQVAPPLFRSMELYRTSDNRQIPLFWNKLAVSTLGDGPHNLVFLSDAMRNMSPRFFLHSLDAVVIVPSEWNWTAEGWAKPYDASKIKISYVDGSLSASQSDRNSLVTVQVKNRVTAPSPGDPQIYVELVRLGEVVSRVTQKTTVPLSEWEVGRAYPDSFNLPIPFNCAQSIHEVRVGFVGAAYSPSEISVKAGELTVGLPMTRPRPLTGQLTRLELPAQLSPGTPGTAKISMRANQPMDLSLSGYLTFSKDGVLCGVIEMNSIAIEKKTPGEVHFTAAFHAPSNLAGGFYQVRFGLHGVSVTSEREPSVEIRRTDTFTAGRPLGFGHYLDKITGQTHFWYVNQSSALIWDGKPFFPVGGMWTSKYLMYFDRAKPAENQTNWMHDFGVLKQMKESGVKDLYINTVANGSRIPAWGWQWVIDHLEGFGFTYGLQFNGRAPEASLSEGYLIRANEAGGTFKIDQVTTSGEISLDFPTSLVNGFVKPMDNLFLLVQTESGKVVQSGMGTTEGIGGGKCKMRATIRLQDPVAHTVYFTPRLQFRGASLVNIWEGGVPTEKALGRLVGQLEFGPNFRLFIDPIQNESGIINWYESMVMDSPVYRGQFCEWLREKYGTLDKLNAAWKMESPVPSFEVAASLIPLQTGPGKSHWENRTILISPPSGNLYFNNAREGVLWDDHLNYRDQSFAGLNHRVAEVIAEHADVPVVYKHVGTFKQHNINRRLKRGFDGLGGEIYGDDPKTLIRKLADTWAVAANCRKTTWFIVTETHLDEDINRKVSSGVMGYPDKNAMHHHFDTLIAGGAKGIYDFLFHGPGDSRLKVYAHTSKPEQFEWLESYRKHTLSPGQVEKNVGSDPEIYTHRFYPPGEMWWFKPNQRTAVLSGDDASGHGSLRISESQWALPTTTWGASTHAIIVNLENAPATTLWGQVIRELPDIKNCGRDVIYLGFRNNLGALPQLDGYFTGEKVVMENKETVQILRPSATSEVLERTAEGKVWAIRDGRLWIVANGTWLGPDHSSVRFVGDLKPGSPRGN